VLKLEGIANRDSIPYAETYELGDAKDLRTILRGTLRFPGFSTVMHSFKSLGLLDSAPLKLTQWTTLAQQSLEARLGIRVPNDPASLLSAISDVVPSAHVPSVIEALEWLSLVPSSSGTSSVASPPLPMALPKEPTPAIELFATLLAHKLRYESHERDLVLLHHEIVVQSLTPGAKKEVHTSSLVAYGDERASAMSRCVGLPVAFATLEVLDGRVGTRGVAGPTEKSLYGGVLRGLEEVGLGMKESMRVGKGMEDVLHAGLSARA
jgi:alpha-aminoadipic semialdehyde synthase